ncbi:hypothetical protein B0J13DRAFT_74758 [Dactylonectria estremocensis]|uniref:Uncharacterized protein n=1 Tax=Dactylonectria estremocensis TaxID=1079267 RepID=A0A9P9IVM0_9HYPO|nr:hypothetical protein B0J13DRAFT_74758 [Dactylonectria estremocensis]
MANPLPHSRDAEILVHTTAPSRVADDTTYRQLTQAYLAFRPQSRTRLPFGEPLPENSSPEQTRAWPQTLAPPDQASAMPSFEQSSEISFQDMSFRGSLDNLSSPHLRYASTAGDVVVSSSQESRVELQTSWCAPPSQISDSYPMPDASLFQVSPTRILQRYIGKAGLPQPAPLSSSPSPQRPRLPSHDLDRVDVPSSLPEPELDTLPAHLPGYISVNQTIPATPQVRKNPAATDVPFESSERCFNESAFDITHISSSAISGASPAPPHRAESEPAPAKRPKVSHLQHGDLVRSSSDTGPVLSTSNPLAEELSNSLEIRAPSPPVGVNDIDPKDLVSEKMAKLARDLSTRYGPDSKRDIDPFERGYWLLDCTTWSPEAHFAAWVFLNNYLGSGLAGWGTWCRRDGSHSWIRLYCFGHVAKHTYLLLYLASGRQLKHTGANWHGADGDVALEVPPHDRPR